MGFLAQFEEIIFDYPNRELYFISKGHKTVRYLSEANESQNGSGISLSLKNDIVLINGLTNQAKVEGVKLGDTILGINDVIFSKEVENGFFEKQKETLTYTIYRNGDSLVKSVEQIRDSKFNQLSKGFRNLDTLAIVRLQRDHENVELIIHPKTNYSSFPDTFQTYTTLNLDVIELFYKRGDTYKKPYTYLRNVNK